VQRGRRLVADQELGPGRERARSRFVATGRRRTGAETCRRARETDRRQQLADTIGDAPLGVDAAVGHFVLGEAVLAQRLGDDVANFPGGG